MITKDEIKLGVKSGVVQFITDPNMESGTVCKIGDNWFYFGGAEAEASSPYDYVTNVPLDDLVDEIYVALEGLNKNGFDDEIEYYSLILTENYDETKPEPIPYTIITNPKLAEFINNNKWWGWYLSADGSYCYSFGRYILAVFMNSDTGELEVTVDDVITDNNVAWETIENIKNPYEIIRGLIKRYCLE